MDRLSLQCMLPALALLLSLQVASMAHAEPADANEYINADRPGIADGSDVVGRGRIQIEAGLQQEYRNAGNPRTLFAPVLLRVGVHKDLELRIEGNTYTRTRTLDSAGAAVKSEGVAPTSVGFKYHFVDAAGSHQPSIGAIFRYFPKSGTGNFRSARATGDFRIAADWDLAPHWSLNPNVGVGIYADDAQRLYTAGLLAATLSFLPSKTLSFFVDAGLQSPETKHGRTGVILDVGAAYVIGRDTQLDLSAGSRAAGTTAPRLFLAAGISRRF